MYMVKIHLHCNTDQVKKNDNTSELNKRFVIMVGYWIDVIMLQVWTVDKQSEQRKIF